MALRKIGRVFAVALSAAGLAAYARFRKEIGEIRDHLDQGSTIAETEFGDIEYADSGEGEPALVIHGAGGGYDQGLLIGRDLGKGYRLIAPSRFGYLKTPVPQDDSHAAQADAHAALLSFLGVERAIVLAASAGAPSAIELALRHPHRVKALILLVPRAYHPEQEVRVDQSPASRAVLRLIENSADFLFWLAMRLQRDAVLRFFGVPPGAAARASDKEQARVDELIKSVLPLSRRVRGIAVDSTAGIQPWPLEKIKAPTLIISAKDDLFKTLPAARFTAEHIPGAELEVLENGGHLMVGHDERVRTWIRSFLDRAFARQRRHSARVLEPVE